MSTFVKSGWQTSSFWLTLLLVLGPTLLEAVNAYQAAADLRGGWPAVAVYVGARAMVAAAAVLQLPPPRQSGPKP